MWLNFEPTFGGEVNSSWTNMSAAALWDNATGLNITVFSPTCDSMWFQPVVGVTSIFYLILSLLATLPNFLFVYAVARSKLLHPNVRILLISLTASCILTCVSLSLQSVYNFLLLFSGNVKQPITTRACAVMQNLRFTSNHVTLFTLVLLSLERLISTHKEFLKTCYRSLITATVCTLIIASWLYALIFTFYDWIPSRGDQYGLCYCENSLNFAFYDLLTYVLIYVIADLVALSVFSLIFQISRRALNDFGINTAHHSLTERFQIWHNIRMIEMLLPSVAVHVVCLLVCNCIMAVCVHLYQTGLEGLSLTVLQSYYFITVVHAFAHPLICIRQNPHVGKTVINLLRGRCARLFRHANEAARIQALGGATSRHGAGAGGTTSGNRTPRPPAIVVDSNNFAKTTRKQPLLRNTVGYQITPEQHQKLMATMWDTTKPAISKARMSSSKMSRA